MLFRLPFYLVASSLVLLEFETEYYLDKMEINVDHAEGCPSPLLSTTKKRLVEARLQDAQIEKEVSLCCFLSIVSIN